MKEGDLNNMAAYDPKGYWESRLSKNFSIAGTGHAGFSARYNRYMYALKARALDRALESSGVSVKDKGALDIGCGSGFFIDYYLKAGARSVTGIDITDISVEALRKRYPAAAFMKVDIGSSVSPALGQFDIISAFDVLYHIVDDGAFANAIANIAGCAAPGATIFITDAVCAAGRPAEHVRYRSAEEYRAQLSRHGIELREVTGITRLLGRSLGEGLPEGVIKRVASRLTESLGWLSYAIDRVHCPAAGSTMSLLVCRKK